MDDTPPIRINVFEKKKEFVSFFNGLTCGKMTLDISSLPGPDLGWVGVLDQRWKLPVGRLNEVT